MQKPVACHCWSAASSGAKIRSTSLERVGLGISAHSSKQQHHEHHLALAGHGMAHQAKHVSNIWALAWPRSRACGMQRLTRRASCASIGLGRPSGPHHQHHLGFGLEPGTQRPPGVHHEHHGLWLATMAHQARIISIIWLCLSRSRARKGHQACIMSIIRPLACSEERIMQACIICIISEPGI